ncbi:WD repeat-containing protein 61 [Mrakia frigida]|uniref:WD40 repeat domain-containing protein n=1 Tax=Mrakia frigida TaxID=29902 RepID=UPI003FCC1A17
MSVQFVVDKDADQAHDDAIWGVKWTTKDQIVSVGLDGALKVWDSHGALVHSPTAHPLGITSLSISPLANRSLSNSIDGTTLLHSLATGQLLGTHQSFLKTSSSATASSWTVAIHPEEKIFASSGAGGKVVLREARVQGDEGFEAEAVGWGEEKRVLETGRDKFGMDLKYSPDGRHLALSSDTGSIFIFDVEAGSLVATYATHSVCVRALSWSPDGQFLFSGSDDKSIILHDVRSSSSSLSSSKISSGVSTLTGHTSWILSLATSPSDGRLLASTSADKTIKLWDVRAGGAGGQKGGCVGTFQEAEGASWGVDWRPLECDQREVGKRFVSGGEEKVVRFWRAAGAA